MQQLKVKDENMVERLAMMDMSPLQDHSQPVKHKTQWINFPTWELQHRHKHPRCGEKHKVLEIIK